MSGIKRLEQAFKLSDFTLEMAKKNILEGLRKKIDSKRVSRELNKRLL